MMKEIHLHNDQGSQIYLVPESNALGILSLVFGVLSLFVMGFLLAPAALVLGIIGLSKGQSKALCIMGIIFSILGMLTSLVLWSLVLAMGVALL